MSDASIEELSLDSKSHEHQRTVGVGRLAPDPSAPMHAAGNRTASSGVSELKEPDVASSGVSELIEPGVSSVESKHNTSDQGKVYDTLPERGSNSNFGEVFGNLPQSYTISNTKITFRAEGLGSDPSLTVQLEWVEGLISTLDFTAAPRDRALTSLVSIEGFFSALQAHLSKSDDCSIDLYDITQTLCHLTDLGESPELAAEQVIGAYLNIVFKGDFSARGKLIRQCWKKSDVGSGTGSPSKPTLKNDKVAYGAFLDYTDGHDPQHKGARFPSTLCEAYKGLPLPFDIALEISTCFAINYCKELVDRREQLREVLTTVRAFQEKWEKLTEGYVNLLDQGKTAGALTNLIFTECSAKIQSVREAKMVEDENMYESHLRAVAKLAAVPDTNGDFEGSIQGVDRAIVRIDALFDKHEKLLLDLEKALDNARAPGNATVDSTDMRDFMMTGSANTAAPTVVLDTGAFSVHTGPGVFRAESENGDPSRSGSSLSSGSGSGSLSSAPLPPVPKPPKRGGRHGVLPALPSFDSEEKAPEAPLFPPRTMPSPTASGVVHPQSSSITDSDIMESLLHIITDKEWRGLSGNERKELIRYYRSIFHVDGLHNRMIKAFLPHTLAPAEASLLENITSGVLNRSDGFDVLSKIISESAVSVYRLYAGQTETIPGVGADNRPVEREVGLLANGPTDLTTTLFEGVRRVETERSYGSHSDSDAAEGVKDENKILKAISDRQCRELDDKNKDSKIQKFLREIVEAGPNDPDVVASFTWDYYMWMLTGNTQPQRTTGLSLPLEAIQHACGSTPSFDEHTGLYGKPRDVLGSAMAELIRANTSRPDMADDASSMFDFGMDAFMNQPQEDEDDYGLPIPPPEDGGSAFGSQQLGPDNSQTGSHSDHTKSLELHMWGRIIGLYLILGPGLDATVLNYPQSMRKTSNICAAASKACINALRHAWCVFVEKHPNNSFSQAVMRSVTTSREGFIELGRALERAAAKPLDVMMKEWRSTNAGKTLDKPNAQLLASIAYHIPRAKLLRQTSMSQPWNKHNCFGDIPFPHIDCVGVSAPLTFESVALVLHDEQAFSWPSTANYFFQYVATYPDPTRALKALAIVASHMKGDTRMTVVDNMAACDILQTFLALHCGFAEVQTLLENMGHRYVAVTVNGTSKMIPAFVSTEKQQMMRLADLATNGNYRGGDTFTSLFTQNPVVQADIKSLAYDNLLVAYEKYKEVPVSQRSQHAVDSVASAARLRALTTALTVEGKGALAFAVLENLVTPKTMALSCLTAVDEDVDENSVGTSSERSGSSGLSSPSGNATSALVAGAVAPPEVKSMTNNAASDYFDREVDSAVQRGHGHEVFVALGMFTKVACLDNRRSGDLRPMLHRVKQAIERILDGTSLSQCLVVKPPRKTKDTGIFPEMLAVSDDRLRDVAKAVCRTNAGTGGLAHPNNWSKAQRAALDFCLVRFVSPKMLSRWPETLFKILQYKFAKGDKGFTRDNAHSRNDAAVKFARETFYARPPTGSPSSNHTLVLSWVNAANHGGHRTKDRKPRKTKEEKVVKSSAGQESAGNASQGSSSSPDAAPAASQVEPADAAGPTVPLSEAETTFLDAQEARLGVIRANEAARTQAETNRTIAEQAAERTVDRLHAEAGLAPRPAASPEDGETPSAVRQAELQEAQFIEARLRAYGRR